jgi:hypothetical protein
LSVRTPLPPSATLLSLFGDELTDMVGGASPSRSIDLRSLQSQNSFNVIPPTSRATNYVVLRYYDVKGDPEVDTPCFPNDTPNLDSDTFSHHHGIGK